MDDGVILKSREGNPVNFSNKIIDLCTFLKTTLEDATYDDPLELDISENILKKIKEFFDHHGYKQLKTIQKPIKTSKFDEITDSWSNNFFKHLSDQEIADLLMAASYLQCSNLFDYCCCYIAAQFRDKTVEELKQEFDIKEELTPELEEQIKKEHSYLFQGIAPNLDE